MSNEISVTIGALVGSFISWIVAQRCIGRHSSTKLMKEFVGNVVPLGLLLASLLLYQYQLQRNTEVRLGGMERILNSQQMRDATTVLSPYELSVAEVLPNYETIIHTIERELVRTQRKFHVFRIQTQQSSPTSGPEDRYFRETEKRLRNGEISDYRRLVRAPTETHVKSYGQLLDNLRDAPTFQMKLWTAQDSPVNFDLVVSDNAAILIFGNNSSQGVPAWAICLRGRETSDRLDAIFEHMWNNSNTVVLKEARSLDNEKLLNSKHLLRNQLVLSDRPKANNKGFP